MDLGSDLDASVVTSELVEFIEHGASLLDASLLKKEEKLVSVHVLHTQNGSLVLRRLSRSPELPVTGDEGDKLILEIDELLSPIWLIRDTFNSIGEGKSLERLVEVGDVVFAVVDVNERGHLRVLVVLFFLSRVHFVHLSP